MDTVSIRTFKTQVHGFARPNNMGIIGLINDILCLLRYVGDAVRQLFHIVAEDVQSMKCSFYYAKALSAAIAFLRDNNRKL
jgi:hypothetical protein